MLKKLFDFLGGIHKTENKSLVASNEFVAGYNLIPQDDATLLKREGRDLISQMITDENKVTGLIQNETEEDVKELFAISVTDLLFKENGTWASKFSGFTDSPFHKEYWQNQCFWGNGIEDIISKRESLMNLRLYVVDAGNNRIQRFEKAIPNKFISLFGGYGTGDGEFDLPVEIAMDSRYIYITDKGNDRVEIFSKAGVFLDEFGTSGVGDSNFDGSRGIAVDAQYIYVVDDGNEYIKKFDKASPYGFVAKVSFGGWRGRGLAVDDQFLYLGFSDKDDVHIYNKVTMILDSSIAMGVGFIPSRIAVDRNETGTNLYVGTHAGVLDRIRVYNKNTKVLVTSFVANGSGDGQSTGIGGIVVDAQYIYVSDSGNKRIQIFKRSDYSFVAKFGATGYLGGQFNGVLGIAMELTATNDIPSFVDYLDAPSRPLALLDVTTVSDCNIEPGDYKYRMTLSDGTNQTNVSQESNSVTVDAAETGKTWLQLLQTVIPDNITNWVLYRKKDAGDYHQLTTVNITDTEYLDDIVEADIENKGAYPIKSTLYDFLDSKIFTFYKESLWILKDKSVYFSYPFQPYYFPSTNYLVIDTKTDATGLKGGAQGMFLFTGNSVSILEGWDIENYEFRVIGENVGCLAHRSIQEYIGVMIWLDYNGIFVSDGGEPIKISSPRVDLVMQDIQIGKRAYICSVIYDDKYILALPVNN